MSEASLLPFVISAVAPESTVRTDGWSGYRNLPKHGYTREVNVLRTASEPAHVRMPHVHLVASLLKRWLLGTFQGAVSPVHLDYYLDEFTFRFNRRTSRHRGLLFYRLLHQALQLDPIPTHALYLDAGRGPPKASPSRPPQHVVGG